MVALDYGIAQVVKRALEIALPVVDLTGEQLGRDPEDVDVPVGTRENHPGEVSGFAPPGDIHRIRNTATSTAVSLHIYGTDITRIGSSARRYYN